MTLFTLLLAGCSIDPTAGTLPDNVAGAFRPCQKSEINFLAAKHNFQTVFEPCGNNSFGAFSWSPDGTRVYFQLGMTAYIMHAEAENKATASVPVPSPIGAADWLTTTRLAVPVVPETPEGPNRLGIFDLEQQSVFYQPVAYSRITKVLRSGDPSNVIALASQSAEGPLSAIRIDLANGQVTPAFPWLDGPVDSLDLTLTTGADRAAPSSVAVVGRNQVVTVHDAASGEVLHTFERATSGTLHSGGRWLALEHLGDPISIFYQRAWDGMSEAQQRREKKKAEKLASSLPASYPTMVEPPMLSIVDLNDGARWALTSVHGTDFQWYEAQPHWASFIFWGFEGKQFKRNVLLGDLGSRLRSTELGRNFMGVVPMNPAAENRAPEPKEPSP